MKSAEPQFLNQNWREVWGAHLRFLADVYLTTERPDLVQDALRLAQRIEMKPVEQTRPSRPPPMRKDNGTIEKATH